MTPAPPSELCRCGAELDTSALNCKTCRESTNQKQSKRYADLKAAGKCTWCGVQAKVNPVTGELDQYCRKHRIARNKYMRDRKTAREQKKERTK